MAWNELQPRPGKPCCLVSLVRFLCLCAVRHQEVESGECASAADVHGDRSHHDPPRRHPSPLALKAGGDFRFL